MKKYLLLFTKLLALAMLVSCTESENTSGFTSPKKEPVQLTESMKAKVKQDNNFAFDLFKEVYKEEPTGNIFVSPLSVSMALSMTMNGAAGTTYDEMRTGLRADNMTRDEINDYSKALRENLLNVDPRTEVAIANSIWYNSDFPVKPSFIEINKLYFDAEVNDVDFGNPNTVNVINAWCADNTNNKIPEILDAIPEDAAMYLINAVYFNGTWKYRFDKKATTLAHFNNEDGTNDEVPMMHQAFNFAYAKNENAAYVKLPYGNESYNMIVALPDYGTTIEELISGMDADNISLLSWNKEKPVVLSLPRFKVECKYDLAQKTLPAMGMNTPFSNMADFSGISVSPTKISRVLHKTYADINEDGTEAAAVTVVEMIETSVGPDEEHIFSVNRPFVFIIQEDSTGAILFIGKISTVL